MMGIIVVGLGPGNGRLLTRAAWELLTSTEKVYFRTKRHPAVDDLPATVERISFDHLYESAEKFEDVYQQIVGELIALGADSDIVYAVPGHPFVGESTVTALVKKAEEANVAVSIEPGISFVEPMLTAVNIDILDGMQLFDAIELTSFHIPPLNPDVPLMLAQVYSRLLASEVKMTLMTLYPDEHPVTLVHSAGTADEIVEAVPLYAIDRSEHINHLTSLYVSPLPYAASLPALAETVAILRSPNGCPWDQEQTPQSMREGFLEEASEVLETLDQNDMDGLREELGDMFYHLVMQTQMATEMEDFRLSDVLAEIDAKLKYRHPHVWGDWEVADSDEVVSNWEMLKAAKKGESGSNSLVDNIPLTLPALARSQKIQNRVRKVGFDWPDISGVYDKLDEEVAELKAAASLDERMLELGDILFVIVNLAKWMGVDAESALREANLRFGQRFRLLEQLVRERSLILSEMEIDDMESLWQEAKSKLNE
ncbi:MAG: nucleoside triphosphate pyrophosphohydrolase [Chloroflexi bacterium]|nr:nucleoside triphosphate pyrophosphohydrolase [Chloroflexota bacterium]